MEKHRRRVRVRVRRTSWRRRLRPWIRLVGVCGGAFVLAYFGIAFFGPTVAPAPTGISPALPQGDNSKPVSVRDEGNSSGRLPGLNLGGD